MRNFISNLRLPMDMVVGNDKAILLAVKNDVEFLDGKPTGKVLGIKYDIVCPKMKYMTTTVKVADATPVMTQEALDAATDETYITFDGFVGKLYQIRGELGLSCRATAARIVQEGKVNGKSN